MDQSLRHAEQTAVPSEMEIVDCFTRLIFSPGDGLSPCEKTIVETLCLVDDNAGYCRGVDEIGAYLRDLGVREMIRLVSRVLSHYPQPAKTESRAWSDPPARA